MNNGVFFGGVLIAISLALSSAAQVPTGGRGGVQPAAGGKAGRVGAPPGDREPTDPRVALEAVEARFREINEEELKQPPKRDYKIEMGQPQRTKLFRADPKLLENKFVVRLVLARRDRSSQGFRMPEDRWDSEPNKEMSERLQLERGTHEHYRSPSQAFKLLAEYCPADQHPDAQLAYLTSKEFDRDVRHMVQGGRFEFTIYAPTAEAAEERVAAIVRLFDCGASRPLQQYLLAEGRKQLAAARATCDEYDKVREEIRIEQAKLSSPSEVSTDILSQLKAQRVMVAVELAGLAARVKACDQMLNEPQRLPVSALQSIGDMKVRAEIERIGTQEKLDRINAFIADGDRRDAIQGKIAALNNRLSTVRREASFPRNAVENICHFIEHYAPRQLEGNAIVISPVEWTE